MSSEETVELQRNRIEEIFDYGLDMDHFTIYLTGVEDDVHHEGDVIEPGVEFRLANRFIKGLDVLQGEDPNRPITICMKTCGGVWEEGMAIYDAIWAVPNPVTVVSYTHARSMSSIILQAANKRVLMPHSTFMFHMGTLSTSGTYKQVMSDISFTKHSEDQMYEIYIDAMKRHGKFSKWGRERIRNMLELEMNKKEDVYLTAEQAVQWGFADEVFTGWGTVTDYTREQKKWNLA